MKECSCKCNETKKGPKEWKGLTTFKIAELDVLRGLPGYADISFVMAETRDGAIKKYYEQNPGAGDRILIYPEGCATIFERPIKAIKPIKPINF